MKITFITNYYNHHQKEFAEYMANLHGNEFTFITTETMSEERKKLGYGNWIIPEFVLDISNGDLDKSETAYHIIANSDVVIAGAVPDELLVNYINSDKLLFRYSERVFKQKPGFFKFIYRYILSKINNYKRSNIYLLCSGGYVAEDFARLGQFKNRCYKWGYFPEKKKYDINELLKEKKQNSILWCGRFLDWKHPEVSLNVAKYLKEEGYEFTLNLIGNGPMEEELKKLVIQYNLTDQVTFKGAMRPEEVRKEMEKAEIFLFTSNRQEGWGAVLNEAMNSGCAVVASDSIGAVPYLIQDGKNGLVYEYGNDEVLNNAVIWLLKHENEKNDLAKNAYNTIVTEWNGEIAAIRFTELVEKLLNNCMINKCFENGPCSPAD